MNAFLKKTNKYLYLYSKNTSIMGSLISQDIMEAMLMINIERDYVVDKEIVVNTIATSSTKLSRFNRYKTIDGSGGFGRGAIGDSDENKHEASSEEQNFYKENKFRVEKLKQIIAYRNKQINEHIKDIIKSIKEFKVK